MIRAFELAIGQLGDPKLRSLIWWSLLLSLVLQVAIAAFGIWGLRSLATFETRWINDAIVWLSGTGVIVLAVMLFPASFGIVISVFMEQIADVVEARHYPQLGKARGIPIWTGIWTLGRTLGRTRSRADPRAPSAGRRVGLQILPGLRRAAGSCRRMTQVCEGAPPPLSTSARPPTPACCSAVRWRASVTTDPTARQHRAALGC